MFPFIKKLLPALEPRVLPELLIAVLAEAGDTVATKARQRGQVGCYCNNNHRSLHVGWNRWRQAGSSCSISASPNLPWHTAHEALGDAGCACTTGSRCDNDKRKPGNGNAPSFYLCCWRWGH